MKHIFLSLIAVLALASVASAQDEYRSGYAEDTTSNAETSYIYPDDATTALSADNYKNFGALEVTMVYDSLTGNPAGTAVLQYCYDAGCTYTYDAASMTLNGNSQVVSRTEDSEFLPLKWRVKITTTGTQTCRLRVFDAWRRKKS